MKCIKNTHTKEIKRVTDEWAEKLTAYTENWVFISRSEWRAANRKAAAK